MRRVLFQRRSAETFGLRFGSQTFTVTVGHFPDGSPGEVFIDVARSGQDLANVARDTAILLSLALQHGTPIETIRHAVTRNGFGEAASVVGAIIDSIGTEN